MQREISSSWQGDTAFSGTDKNDLIGTLGDQLEIGWMEVVLTAWNLKKNWSKNGWRTYSYFG